MSKAEYQSPTTPAPHDHKAAMRKFVFSDCEQKKAEWHLIH
jgi:hypothetical protein